MQTVVLEKLIDPRNLWSLGVPLFLASLILLAALYFTRIKL